MQLIANVRDRDSNPVINLDDTPTMSAMIIGNRLTITDDEGKVVLRALMELDHNVPVWRVYRGARGHEVGIAQSFSFYV